MYHPTEEDGKHVLRRLRWMARYFHQKYGQKLNVCDYMDIGLARLDKAMLKATNSEHFRAYACNGAWFDMQRTTYRYRVWRDCSKKGQSMAELESKAEPRISYTDFIGRRYLDPWIALMLRETYARLDAFEMICVTEVWIDGQSLREVQREYHIGRRRIRKCLASARRKFKLAIHGG